MLCAFLNNDEKDEILAKDLTYIQITVTTFVQFYYSLKQIMKQFQN